MYVTLHYAIDSKISRFLSSSNKQTAQMKKKVSKLFLQNIKFKFELISVFMINSIKLILLVFLN